MRKYEIKKLDMEINIAPLIDVVFLLLLFFMLASTLDTNEIRATIQLPQAEGQISREKDKSIALYLDKNGMIYVGKEHISWDVLPSYLKENIGGFHDSHDSIEVYADKEVDFDYVARIMVMGGKLEIEKINFQNNGSNNLLYFEYIYYEYSFTITIFLLHSDTVNIFPTERTITIFYHILCGKIFAMNYSFTTGRTIGVLSLSYITLIYIV